MIAIFLLIVMSARLTAQQDSYLQVKAEPNIKVFLNDEFKGTTNVEFNGLIIEELKAGTYNIRVDKEGFTPQSETIILNPGEVKIYQVKPFVPKYKITQSGNKQQQTIALKTGSLKIQSLPVEIQIEITDLNIKSAKSDDEWKIEDIPVGLYSVKFTWSNKVLFDTIRIDQNKLMHVFADLINSKVEIRSNNIYQNDIDEEVAYKGNGNSYNLQGRTFLNLATPKYDYSGEGKVVVEISVDRNGRVIEAIPGVKGSTTLDEYLLQVSKKAALQSIFQQKSDAPAVQKGTITYNFMLR